MRIKKINKTKSISKTNIGQNILNKSNSLAKQAKQNHTNKSTSRRLPNTLSGYLTLLRTMAKAFTNKLKISNCLDYLDKERLDRAKSQLKVFFLNSTKKGVFSFVVKSSGLNMHSSYIVEIQFRDIEKMLLKNPKLKAEELIEGSAIRTQCTCDDFRYRFRYWHTKMGSVLGYKENRFPKITNAKGQHLFLCKHQALVLTKFKTKPIISILDRYIKNTVSGKGTYTTKNDKIKTYLSGSK